jgi:antitoxin HicB
LHDAVGPRLHAIRLKKAAFGIVVEHPPMAVERSYTVVLLPEPQTAGFSVSVPALPEIATQGETEEEAVANAREAVSLVVSDRAKRGEDIPPSDIDAPRFERIAVAA